MVKGSPALVAAIDRRVRVRVEEEASGVLAIESGLFRLRMRASEALSGGAVPREAEPFLALLRRLREIGYDLIPHRAVIEGGVPVSAGLGSSASTAVAYALAYTALHGDPLRGRRLFEAAMAAEEVAHEKPSGVDVAAAIEGGFLYYRRGGEPRRLPYELRGATLIVADTGVKRRTSDVVVSVLSTARALGEAGELIYKAGSALAEMALDALLKGDAERLGLAMNAAHGLLSALGASSPEIEGIVHAMRSAGALGAKLTGAGRGGAVIGLTRLEDSAKVLAAASRKAASAFEAALGAPGARLEGGNP